MGRPASSGWPCEKLKIDPRDFTFTDFGSGEGRVLLIAAGLPFRAVVGVEFSAELNEIASRISYVFRRI
jgi:hypothetical protein